MITQVRIALITAALGTGLLPACSGAADSLLSRATQIFGPPLNPQHMVFGLNGNWVIWLIANRDGDMIEADVGLKSRYVVEFPEAPKEPDQGVMSKEEYERTIHTISKLKNVGQLREMHGRPEPSDIGLINIDGFERAFVERVVAPGDEDRVTKFNVYFLQQMGVSPEQITKSPPPSMVCLSELWYYVPSEEAIQIRLGDWQKLRMAGPALRSHAGCVRTTPVHDADGFTIEQPQNETIVLSKPFRVRELVGNVHDISNSPMELASVELLRVGAQQVIRTVTDANGNFRLSASADGQYRFKVTKDGFKALRGIVIVDKHGSGNGKLSFELPVGT